VNALPLVLPADYHPPHGDHGPALPVTLDMDIHRFQMQDYAEKYFTIHRGRRRFWRRKRVDLSMSLHWNTDGDVLLRYGTSKAQHAVRKSAERVSKLVLTYMGDRFYKGENRDRLVLELLELCVAVAGVRDELYCQLVKQTSENPNRTSLLRGWELFAIASAFVPPTRNLHSYLLGYASNATKPHDDGGSHAAWKHPQQRQQPQRPRANTSSVDGRDSSPYPALDVPLNHPETDEALHPPSVERYARFAQRRLQRLANATRQEFLGKLHSPKLHEVCVCCA
jgi:MyTH4 domain